MKQQLHFISYMRVTAMVMVVIYHCVSYYCVWDFPGFRSDIYGIFAKFLNYIDMPAFVFVSGYLYSFNLLGGGKYKNNKKFIEGKCKRLLLPQ